MKKVFSSHAELAHVWAGQKQENGRSSSGNMFFEGPSIYSYGRHFEIARWYGKGPGAVVLFNSASYSNSTCKHQNHTARAINHARVFRVPSMTDHGANVCAYLAKVEEARAAALRAVKYGPMHKAAAERAAKEAAQYVDAFKKHVPAKLRDEVKRTLKLVQQGKLFTAAEMARIAASDERRRDADEKARVRREEQRVNWEKTRAERAAYEASPAYLIDKAHNEAAQEELERTAPLKLDAWARGEVVDKSAWAYYWNDLPTRLRLDDGRVLTSRGAQITERKARELWAALVRGVDVAGVELDHYTVTSWDGARLIVGCHDIERAELERMAAALGLPGTLPAAAPVAA